MLIPSHYTLNVAVLLRHGRYDHYCRIELGGSRVVARTIADDMRRRFPYPEFKLDLTHVECVGHSVPLDDETETPYGWNSTETPSPKRDE